MKWRATFRIFEYDEWNGESVRTDRKSVREIYADSYDNAVIKANIMGGEEERLMFIEFVSDSTEPEEDVVDMMKRFQALGF